jgi:hypothetical protein
MITAFFAAARAANEESGRDSWSIATKTETCTSASSVVAATSFRESARVIFSDPLVMEMASVKMGTGQRECDRAGLMRRQAALGKTPSAAE